MSHAEMFDQLFETVPVLPVMVIPRADQAAPLADALAEGGLTVLEITLRTEDALQSLAAIASHRDDIVAGAGTVLTADDAKRVKDAGAKFAISPGLTEDLARAAADLALPLLPGVASASDIMRGLDLGLSRFKLFPANVVGGPAAVKALGGPFGDIRFCPTGGVTLENAADYLKLPNVMCVGGSWLAPADLCAKGDWDAITRRARQAVDALA